MVIFVQALCHVRDIFIKCLHRFLNSKRMAAEEPLLEVTSLESAAFHKDFGIVFFPPVFTQRYAAVCDLLQDDRWAGEIQKVVDFGCSELSMVRYLKSIPGIANILCVDMDAELLCQCKRRAEPIINDYIMQRTAPLNVKIIEGSAADPDFRLIGCDAVVCIELIEHMNPQDLERMVHTVFGFIRPRIAIFTTPNSDFNVLFDKMKENGFRHDDHRFEWSRSQFEDWSKNIVVRYPDFEVNFQGVGPGPKSTLHLGCCSQLACFVNNAYCKLNSLQIDNPEEYFARTNFKDLMKGRTTHSTDEDAKIKKFYDSLLNIVVKSLASSKFVRRRDDSDPELDQIEEKQLCASTDNDMTEMCKYYRSPSCSPYRIKPNLSSRNYYAIDGPLSRLSSPIKKPDVSKSIQLKHFEDVFTKERDNSQAEFITDYTLLKNSHNDQIWWNINWAEDAPDWFNYYKVLTDLNYPFRIDSRTQEQKIVDEVAFKMQAFVHYGDDYYNPVLCQWEMPLEDFMPFLSSLTDDIDLLRCCLVAKGYKVENNMLIYVGESQSDGSSSHDYYANDQDCNGQSHKMENTHEECWDDWNEGLQEWNDPKHEWADFNSKPAIDNESLVHNNPEGDTFSEYFMDIGDELAIAPMPNTHTIENDALRRSYSLEDIPSFNISSTVSSHLEPRTKSLATISADVKNEDSIREAVGISPFMSKSETKKLEAYETDEKSGSSKIIHSAWSDEAKLYDSGYQKSQDSPLSPCTFSSGLLTPDKESAWEHSGLECILENLNCGESSSFTDRQRHKPNVFGPQPSSAGPDRPADLRFEGSARPMSPELDPIEVDTPVSPLEPLIYIDAMGPMLPIQNLRVNIPNGDMLNNNQDYEGNLLIEEARPPDLDAIAIEQDIIQGNI